MPVKYEKVWRTMNDLGLVISKVISAREMIDVANEALEYNQKERAEKLTMAAYEFLGYFIEEFDEKFKDAWEATVGDLREGDVREDDCIPPWGHSDLEYLIKNPPDNVKKWVLPVELDGLTGECFIMLPDDLLEVANLEEGDQVEWIDNKDGSFTMRKVSQPLKMEEC